MTLRPTYLCLLIACSLAMAPSHAAERRKPAANPAARAAVAAPLQREAPQLLQAVQPVRELGGIREYRLANGLQVLLFPDESQSTTLVNITYRVGSRHESQGEYGMAHLLEHLVFKGTPTYKDIPTALAERGVRFNGTTTTDRTNYFASFNANADTLAFMLALEADRMRNSFIAKSDLDTEMTVVRNEFERGENQPLSVLGQRVQAVAFDWHAYGHSTIGPKSDIENVPIEKLQAFYRRYYRPDNATLLIAGRFDVEATLRQIAERFGPIARPAEPIPEPYTVEPAQDGERSVVVRRVGGQPMLLAHYHVPAIAHADSAPLIVLGLLMSLQPSGQLYKELVETRLALAARLGGLGGQSPGSAQALAVLAPDADAAAIAKVEARLLDLVEGRAGAPFTEDDLRRVRDLALNSYREQMKNPEALIQQISSLLGAGDWRLLFQLLEDLPQVTLADVERVRKAYFRPANRTLGRYLPASEVERVQIPVAPPLAERLAQLKPPPVVEQGERFEPTPQALEARTQRRRLPSGIELQTLQKQTRGNGVSLQLQLRWGEPRATTAALGTNLVGQLIGEGSAQWDKQKLRDELVRLKASLQVSSGNQGATLSIHAERDTLLPVLSMAAQLMREPLLPAEAFERFKRGALAGLEASRQELGTLASEASRPYFNAAGGFQPGDPDYRPSLDERLDELRRTTLDDVRRFHRDYWSANEARFAVVGALPEGLDQALEREFGAWKKPAAPRFVRHISVPLKIAPKRFDVEAKDKTSAMLAMSQPLELGRQDPDYLPMVLAVHVFGGGGMESRLSTRVRRQEGLSYGIGAGLQTDSFGRDARLEISGSYAPQNRERILGAVQEELRAMSESGPTAAELARAKHDVLEGWKQSRADDGVLAGTLLRHAELGKTWPYEAQREAELQAVTLEQLRAAWQRLIKPEGFVLTTAGDFAGSQAK